MNQNLQPKNKNKFYYIYQNYEDHILGTGQILSQKLLFFFKDKSVGRIFGKGTYLTFNYIHILKNRCKKEMWSQKLLNFPFVIFF